MKADSKSVLLLTKVEMYTVAAALTDYLENDQGEPNNRSDEVHDLATARDTEISLDRDAVKDLLRKVTERADNLHTLLPPHLIIENTGRETFNHLFLLPPLSAISSEDVASDIDAAHEAVSINEDWSYDDIQDSLMANGYECITFEEVEGV